MYYLCIRSLTLSVATFQKGKKMKEKRMQEIRRWIAYLMPYDIFIHWTFYNRNFVDSEEFSWTSRINLQHFHSFLVGHNSHDTFNALYSIHLWQFSLCHETLYFWWTVVLFVLSIKCTKIIYFTTQKLRFKRLSAFQKEFVTLSKIWCFR